MEQYFGMLALAFARCLTWFSDILTMSGMASLYSGCLVAFLTYKFLLAPIFGVHQSDTARKNLKNMKKDNKE